MSHIIGVLARVAARKAVKEQLRGQGRKPQHMAAAEISEAAEGWLRTHPQLFAEALERVCASPTLRPFLERELAKRGKEITAALMHNSPSVDLLGLPLCKCQERNGGTDDHRLRSGFDGRADP